MGNKHNQSIKKINCSKKFKLFKKKSNCLALLDKHYKLISSNSKFKELLKIQNEAQSVFFIDLFCIEFHMKDLLNEEFWVQLFICPKKKSKKSNFFISIEKIKFLETKSSQNLFLEHEYKATSVSDSENEYSTQSLDHSNSKEKNKDDIPESSDDSTITEDFISWDPTFSIYTSLQTPPESQEFINVFQEEDEK
ncbi:hypothetical protein M0811_12024 [Anaeramoeba ignava]|uniref:Uncharacterized protein n=1 Tax=Anaeramoeba ignava TaxID=1746090 RepID=A0A9Q0L9V9_ANAIG|nr:hypothetical protein M0811_12024 [Anaeramoeba ignava]